jgi:hypothetical protein
LMKLTPGQFARARKMDPILNKFDISIYGREKNENYFAK